MPGWQLYAFEMIPQSSRPIEHALFAGNLADQVSSHVLQLMSQKLSPDYIFHNQRFTVLVVHAVRAIAKGESLPYGQMRKVQIAAWFNHVGLIHRSHKHREVSADLAYQFLKRQKARTDDIEEITSTILNSGSPWEVCTTADKILYDANWYFLAASNYREMLDRYRKEKSIVDGSITDARWMEFLKDCFIHQKYLTTYAQDVLQSRKKANFESYQRQLTRMTRNVYRPKSVGML